MKLPEGFFVITVGEGVGQAHNEVEQRILEGERFNVGNHRVEVGKPSLTSLPCRLCDHLRRDRIPTLLGVSECDR